MTYRSHLTSNDKLLTQGTFADNDHKDASCFTDAYKVETKHNKRLGNEGRDICANITLYTLKYTALSISLFSGGNMYGIKIIIALVILGLFNASVKGKWVDRWFSFVDDFGVDLTHAPFLYLVSFVSWLYLYLQEGWKFCSYFAD